MGRDQTRRRPRAALTKPAIRVAGRPPGGQSGLTGDVRPVAPKDSGGHTYHMASRAVLTRRGADTTLELRPQWRALPRETSDDELHLGSQDLLRLADYANRHGFQIASFSLSDTYLSPLASEEQSGISDRLISLYREYGLEELLFALAEEYEGLYITGLTLINIETGRRVQIKRRGYVETSSIQEAETLLRSAWNELNLS